ncbi:MAG: flagellar biosynthesis protein FlgF, partial [Caulobacterales bacterium]|nr:flagellar biosynthesis protein FlgF [Caulobacterales bacterium]
FTRDGRFNRDADGRLVTAMGKPVLDEAGGEIILDPQAGQPEISADGAILSGGQEIARLAVVRLPEPSAMTRAGDGLYAAEGQEPEPVEEPRVRQGFAEGSNVSGVIEITRMMEVSRTYQSVSKMIETHEDMKRRAVERLGQSR